MSHASAWGCQCSKHSLNVFGKKRFWSWVFIMRKRTINEVYNFKSESLAQDPRWEICFLNYWSPPRTFKLKKEIIADQMMNITCLIERLRYAIISPLFTKSYIMTHWLVAIRRLPVCHWYTKVRRCEACRGKKHKIKTFKVPNLYRLIDALGSLNNFI